MTRSVAGGRVEAMTGILRRAKTLGVAGWLCMVACSAARVAPQPAGPPAVVTTADEPPAAQQEPAPREPPVEVAASVDPPLVVEGYTAEVADALAEPYWIPVGRTRIGVGR